jgi:hypothetical protein
MPKELNEFKRTDLARVESSPGNSSSILYSCAKAYTKEFTRFQQVKIKICFSYEILTEFEQTQASKSCSRRSQPSSSWKVID